LRDLEGKREEESSEMLTVEGEGFKNGAKGAEHMESATIWVL
jgi:hypothetical protein